MKIRRALLVLATTLVGLIAVAGSAQAAPPQAVPLESTELPGTNTAGEQGFCPFPVRIDAVSNQKTTTTTNPDGSTSTRFSGYASATVTNLVTAKSLTYKISGPGTLTIRPDGSFSVDATGQNLLWTTVANSFPGVPQVAYSTGHVTFSVAASGLTTAYSLSGRRTDVCAALK